MKIIYEAMLRAAVWAAEKIHKDKVVQVDIWLDGGRRLCIMDQDEANKLVHMATQLNSDWTEQEKEELKIAIKKIRSEEGLNG